MTQRRATRIIQVGDVQIGGNATISVQSMTKTDTRDIQSTVKQIKQLEEVGCDIIRCAVPNQEAAIALRDIKKQIKIPLIADIHFHYHLALEAIKSGVDALTLWTQNQENRARRFQSQMLNTPLSGIIS